MNVLGIFAERLQELISDYGYDAISFAQELDIDVSVIRKYLRKEILPSVETIIRMANIFRCSTDYIIGLSLNEGSPYPCKNTSSFSERFRELLETKKISRYKLCKDCGFADQTADDWYHGKRMPSLANCIELCSVFDCSLDYLLGRESNV